MNDWTPPRGYETIARRPPAPKRRPMTISDAALRAERVPVVPDHPFEVAKPMPGVVPEDVSLAMDSFQPYANLSSVYAWAAATASHEGLRFFGYPYLAQLLQRPEYRRIVGIRAQEATRKWIKLHGADDEKLGELDAALNRHRVQSVLRDAFDLDGGFGRAQIYIDTGATVTGRQQPLVVTDKTIRKGSLKGFKTVEPYWSYPGVYNSTDPLAPDFYIPTMWYVMGQTVHASRLLTLVGQEVPDILKPAYQFGGLAMTQMCKPYVDNFIRNRQSASDMLNAFSVMVLATDMSSALSGGGRQTQDRRAQLFTQFRDNNGLFMVAKDEETLENVSASLAGIRDLVAQSQEQICTPAGIPLVKYTGITPGGLNASSAEEITVFHEEIHSYQERVGRDPLTTMIRIVQLDLWGAIDENIDFDFVTLDDADEVEESTIRKTNADTDAVYMASGVLSPDEIRERLAQEDGGQYNGITLDGPAPGIDDEPDDDDPAPNA